jgi:hypothetical protein
VKEQAIQKKIIVRLEKADFVAINLITASKAGYSDVIACSPYGWFWSIEVKKPGERPSRIQYHRLSQFEKRNAIAFWCDSYESFLEQFDKATIVEANRRKSLPD